MIRKFVILLGVSVIPSFAQLPTIDAASVAALGRDIAMARQAYQLEQQIHAFVRNPGQWRYLVQTQAMRMGGQLGGKLGNVNPLILNAANLAVLSQGRLSAAQALNRAAAISNLTNENASLGSILSLQAAQATVAEQTIQAQMDIETQLNVYLKRGSGLGGQAAKIQNWEMK